MRHCYVAPMVNRQAWLREVLGVAMAAGLGAGFVLVCAAGEDFAAVLPEGVKAVWDLDKAHRDTTSTRDRICLNGLWRWQPAAALADGRVPEGRWGYFKVPGSWPGITDYLQKDSQTVFAHRDWRETKLSAVVAAWYEREFTLPVEWAGRRITVRLEYVNSYAAVYLDGARVGEVRFPGGEADLSAVCQPGRKHRLSLLVMAMPLKGVLMSYSDTAAAREVKGTVARRGLCGDVGLISMPPGARIATRTVDPSVRRGRLTVSAALEGLQDHRPHTLCARVTGGGETWAFSSLPFTGGDLGEGGRMAFDGAVAPAHLWDLHTPGNCCELELTLRDADGRPVDVSWRERFGFREFWVDGRDFYLNGSRVFLSAVPLDNAQVGAAAANYAAARESLERLKAIGVNFVYTHNYGCEPGSHLGFGEMLRAADDVGMLVALSQPHFSHYDWPTADADRTNGYARHAAFYTEAAGSHPSVVMYAMSHNATGYNEDMNPDMIDGIQDARDSWASKNVGLARRAEALVRRLDPSRRVYHHASGNLGPMHAVNFYPNFVPIQELSDWFEHWATAGVKPVFLCEFGAPFTWDWALYRGWYQGRREFGSAVVPWEFCLAEWNAQFVGDAAFPASEAEQANLRWEARQFRQGARWHRWDYPQALGSTRFHERYPVFAAYVTDTWRAFRTWGVSALSPWEYGHFWQLRPGADRTRRALSVDWEQLQRPGFSPDYVESRSERMDLDFDRSDWVATLAAQALLRNNGPVLAYLGGKPARFTSQDHNFLPGETFEKQLIVINNSRAPVAWKAAWALALPEPVVGHDEATLQTGEQIRIPLRFILPEALAPGEYKLTAKVEFETGEVQDDEFAIHLQAQPATAPVEASVAVFDPRGETIALMTRLGFRCRSIDAQTRLAAADLVVVGKAALTADRPAPDLQAVREGLRVLVFEQTAEVLEKRLGFRVAEYGLRQVFPRVPDHPVLAGLQAAQCRDWRGAATLLPARLEYQLDPRFNGAPTVMWCGLPVTRLWRCGCQGNVASVLIEKPACGNFLPIVDGGFSLQYSPLIEYREGRGMVFFCQMDVTGRTETDPAADALVRNLVRYAVDWRPAAVRRAVYVGEPGGRSHLKSVGLNPDAFDARPLSKDDVLVVGPGGGRPLSGRTDSLSAWLASGGNLLGLGLDQDDLDALPGLKATVKRGEHISTGFAPFDRDSRLAGIGPADVHNRDPREVPLVVSGARAVGNGVLAQAADLPVVLCQLAPWRFAQTSSRHLKLTHRRLSFLVTRMLGNLGVAGATPLLDRFERPVDPASGEKRWLEGFYVDTPEEWDDPYRFFRW